MGGDESARSLKNHSNICQLESMPWKMLQTGKQRQRNRKRDRIRRRIGGHGVEGMFSISQTRERLERSPPNMPGGVFEKGELRISECEKDFDFIRYCLSNESTL